MEWLNDMVYKLNYAEGKGGVRQMVIHTQVASDIKYLID